MDRTERAVALKHNGCNCAQAVLAVYDDLLALPPETLRQLGAAFGNGMGCMEATCGSLCAAQMVLGLLRYQGKPVTGQAKQLLSAFAEATGATVCKDIKGRDTGTALCACDDCVRNAVAALETIIQAS